MFDIRFKTGSALTVVGPSLSGKTTFIEHLVSYSDVLFDKSFSSIHWFCAFQPYKKLDNVIYHDTIPKMEQIKPNSLIIVDDFMQELSNSNEFTNLLTKGVHHLPCTLIYITQNLFQNVKDSKTRRMNTAYLILFKNPHDKSQIQYLGRQMFPRDKDFLVKVFDHVTKNKRFSYILLDLHPETNEKVKVRTNILPFEYPPIVFQSIFY